LAAFCFHKHSSQALGALTGSAPPHGRAAEGDITVLVGGPAALFEAHKPAFQAMGGEMFYIGPLGSAAIIKVITNMLAFVHLVATGEALMLARRGGLDLAQAWQAIRASSGNSFVHETEGPWRTCDRQTDLHLGDFGCMLFGDRANLGDGNAQ
jgi:3-hydroxyisobutyrate dehydrogenase-like beta-hydroxyacid dehydrogenase